MRPAEALLNQGRIQRYVLKAQVFEQVLLILGSFEARRRPKPLQKHRFLKGGRQIPGSAHHLAKINEFLEQDPGLGGYFNASRQI